MDKRALKNLITDIVKKATVLKNKYVNYENTPVNYACIFSQSVKEYDVLLQSALQLGSVIQETPTGPLFRIEPLVTVSGVLQLLKIRKYDPTRPEQGDADFTVFDFSEFEKKYLSRPNFKLIKKPHFDMIELMDPDYDVRVYFSNPPLDKQLGIC